MRSIKVGEDTQVAINVPIFVYGARLTHTSATTADIYDEVEDSGVTATKKKIALAVTAEKLTDEVFFPAGKTVRFDEGLYVDWTAGDLYIYID